MNASPIRLGAVVNVGTGGKSGRALGASCGVYDGHVITGALEADGLELPIATTRVGGALPHADTTRKTAMQRTLDVYQTQ